MTGTSAAARSSRESTTTRMPRVQDFTLQVCATHEAGPYTRLRVRCPELLNPRKSDELLPTAWLRLLVPDGGRQHQRGYTLVECDHGTGEASIYMLHHDPAGPGSRWARSARPGDRIGAQLLAGQLYLQPPPDAGALYVGDLASAPAIAGAIAAAPASCDIAVVLQAEPGSWSPVPHTACTLTIVSPDAGEDALIEAVTTIPGRDYAWLALEASAAQPLRAALIAAGLPRDAVQYQGYWRRGTPMGRTVETSARAAA
ncbi:siderophore-interacting protein [Propionibacterium freudenreichii]|uniref:Transmembrane ATP-binding protein ABC transporter n=3 Tax=Propionibacterium freudenreichii TaxID=1744 RepID=D7GH21_PROFC|nr:SIP domain-containing protein [Propionibacterium freudenreichii]CBL57832.1 Transmembrane ATP-binding protein ABC transporter [Propionibacterium freudenreichii subsp. shermanii CIRM-BIA1]MDK9294172.1 SIP domain-containing protein [Propionibacterium freudenreichii]MDK9300156.1 SIP domain-containing protein [Propionibacterium freudenreichii]MDK9319069.1 SIP domain-containing protein [Propionibacterium freudenreichii]MDK9352153.1 SIP domain-containing protein [Propionibacterium freudenreichii]